MSILSQIAKAMQDVLHKAADVIGRETKFIQRERKLSGSKFVQMLVFGWLDNPDASLGELTQTGADLGISISEQGLDQRFTQQATECLRQVLHEAVNTVITTNSAAIPVLQRFNGVFIQDSSEIVLPDSLAVIWPGCGGSMTKNTSSAIKLQSRIDLNTGKLTGPHLQSVREHDQNSSLYREPLPAGSLRIADLGYFSLKGFSDMSSQGAGQEAYWLSRVKSQCDIYDQEGRKWDLLEFLQANCNSKDGKIDVQVFLGAKEKVPCRLIAACVPEEVANERRRKLRKYARRHGKTPSQKSLKLADWTILGTSAPYELLTTDGAFVLMRIRWQIELLFKLWKDHGKIDEWRSEKPWRILCELYAKLLAMIIQHWVILVGGWRYPERSLLKAAKVVQKHATYLAIAFSKAFAFGCEQYLYEALEVIRFCLSSGCRINKRKTKPNAYDLLVGIFDSA